MGTRMIRDRSNDGRWWLMVGLFTLCVVGFSFAFSLKAEAAARSADRVWQVSDFDRISILGSPDVQLVQGDTEGVYGYGDDDDLDRYDVFVQGNELVVRPKDRKWFSAWGSGDVSLIVELQNFSQLQLSGSGGLTADSLAAQDLELTLSGSSDLEFNSVSVRSLDVTISGSADVKLAGQAENQSVRISGSADYDAVDLSSETAKVRISGSAAAQIQVAGKLEARVSGSGSVRYLGKPTVSQRVAGSGEIGPL